MKNIKYVLFILSFMFMTTSCYDFLNVNVDPDAPVTITLEQALPTILFYASQLTYDHAEYGVYLAQALTTQHNLERGSLAYSSGWDFVNMNRHPQWRRHFFDIGMNNKRMMDLAEEQGAKNFLLIGRTIRLMSTMLTTDAFGDMPHSDAYLATSPTYDTQYDIYQWMFREADELVRLYADESWTQAPGNVYINERMDRIYGGDLAKWGAFTQALRVRLWLRKLPNWENTSEVRNRIIEMAEAVLNNPAWGANGEGEPRYYYPGGPTESNNPWGPARPVINAWESRGNRLHESIPTRFFGHILGVYNGTGAQVPTALDPRAVRLMTPRSGPTTGEAADTRVFIRTLESNIGMDPSLRVVHFPCLYTEGNRNNPLTQNTSPIILMMHEELLFIKAEALYWEGRTNEAYQAVRAATRHNMIRLGALPPGDDGYGSSLSGTPTTNTPLGNLTTFNRERLNATDFTIATLMQQKFVAMYLQPEQWTDMRRYNHSSATNGITYRTPTGVHEVYTVRNVHRGPTPPPMNQTAAQFSETYALRRPFNLFSAHWMTPEDFVGADGRQLSPNAWIHRLNYDPETEERYSQRELERLGAFRNPDWLRRRMIWAKNESGFAETSNSIPWQ